MIFGQYRSLTGFFFFYWGAGGGGEELRPFFQDNFTYIFQEYFTYIEPIVH